MASNPQGNPSVSVTKISVVSPSLAESLRNCHLQAGLSRIPALHDYVLGNPKAWLGTAYHEVLENLWSKHPELTEADLVDQLWTSAIELLNNRASIHPLNRRFGVPEHWPGFNLTRAFVRIRAERALAEKPRSAAAKLAIAESGTLREEKLWAMDGKLTGKPDVVVGDEIRDYKSGRVFEKSDDGQEVVKQLYVNQLLLYGHLVHENTGQCPTKGMLMPMQGQEVEVALDPTSCASAAAEAVGRLGTYNERVATASDATALASPSPSACRWCQYKTVCPAFWDNVAEDWTEELGSAAVCGQLNESPKLLHNGKAYMISIAVACGTTSDAEVIIAPLDCSIHAHIGNYQVGDEVRIINLYLRRDGRLSPTVATVCMRTVDFPSVLVDAELNTEVSVDAAS